MTLSSCRKRQQILRLPVANPLLPGLPTPSLYAFADPIPFLLLQWRDLANVDDLWCSLSSKDMPVDFPNPVAYRYPKGCADWKRAYEKRHLVNQRWDQGDFKVH